MQETVRSWWTEVRGDSGSLASIKALGIGVGVVAFAMALATLFVLIYRNAIKWKVWRRLGETFFARRNRTIIEFYDRMQKVLTSGGLVRGEHQTPLEFAHSIEIPVVFEDHREI